MELTGRRFAAFMALGLGLAVVLGLVVWKLPDAGVSLASDKSDYAGHPITAADATNEHRTAQTEKTTPRTEQHTSSRRKGSTTRAASPKWDSGSTRDPLAPHNAKLDGTAGQATREQAQDLYRPRNATPKARPRPSYSERNDSPSARATHKPTHKPTPSVVESAPSEPVPDTTPPTAGDIPADGTPTPGTSTTDKPTTPTENQSGEGQNTGTTTAHHTPDTGEAEDAPVSDPKARPEDPFSASTREAEAPSLTPDNS